MLLKIEINLKNILIIAVIELEKSLKIKNNKNQEQIKARNK